LKHFTLILSILLLSLCSCFKKEDPIDLPEGNSEIASFYLGQNYTKDVFFDLGTNTYQERTWADWDIRFDASKDGYAVYINTGKEISVRKIDRYFVQDLKSQDTNYVKDFPELVEPPEGKPELSAMGGWPTYGKPGSDGIYAIELKYNSVGRWKRLQIINKDDTAYFVRITNIEDKTGEITIIPKNPNQNYTYFSFASNSIVPNAEPDKGSWDFVFTRYAHIFYNVLPDNKPFPYILSGVLSNNNHVEVARDSAVTNFEDIDGNSIGKYQFSTNKNVIGYDWKMHAQGPGGAYSIVPKVTYIIKDTDGNYYKLRFLDYNNEVGQSGYPKFEFIRIR
jgi:hypothetical protein